MEMLMSTHKARTSSRQPVSVRRSHRVAASYDRERDLPRLIPLWPCELADTSAQGRQRIIALLRRMLREERRRGLGRHWSYDLARHIQMLAAYRAEVALAAAEKGASTDRAYAAREL
jgi:hypothetical protein